MTRDGLLALLAGPRQARIGAVRVPHKPLLLLWLFGQFAATVQDYSGQEPGVHDRAAFRWGQTDHVAHGCGVLVPR